MTDQEIERGIRAIRETAAEARNSPEKAKELLFMTGMYTKDGQLKEQFR